MDGRSVTIKGGLLITGDKGAFYKKVTYDEDGRITNTEFQSDY